MDEHMIHKIWWDRLDGSERNRANTAKSGHAIENKKERITEKKAIDYAINHSLERLSVVDRQELLVLGVKRGMGSITSLEGLKKELDHRSDLLVGQNRRGKTIYTKQEALDEEASLKEAAVMVGVNWSRLIPIIRYKMTNYRKNKPRRSIMCYNPKT